MGAHVCPLFLRFDMRYIASSLHKLAALAILILAAFACMGAFSTSAYASDTDTSAALVDVSATGDSARIEGCSYAAVAFQRVQTGSNREIDDVYHGYTYLLDGDEVIALDTANYAVVYVPESLARQFDIDIENTDDQRTLQTYIEALDDGAASGNTKMSSQDTWYFTTDEDYVVGDVRFIFNNEIREGRLYTCIIGVDGSDVRETVRPICADTMRLVPAEEAVIAGNGTVIDQLVDFFSKLDWSPLWVTLRTTGVAIVFIFILGLAAAYFTLRIPKRAQDIFDTIFTIPMVLPPTVCGFILLWCLGNNTALGRWFIDIGFPLIFSWPATVIAAVVVAFPLMYRSSRGAFENLDANMLDAARTLGWSNSKIFFRLMIPLSWGSIAAATVLAFARALGEFGATLFLAGNYAGITRTIPIAIYFEWMGGNSDVAWFWTAVILVFSFVVILLINLLGRRTTRYRVRSNEVRDKSRKRTEKHVSEAAGMEGGAQ